MLIFDAHLDLAMNALEWNRDLRRPLEEIRQREEALTDKPDRGNGTVCLPEMRRGGIGLCVATQIARLEHSAYSPAPGWRSPEQAWAMTQAQLAWYRVMEEVGEMAQIHDAVSLERHLKLWDDESDAGRALPRPPRRGEPSDLNERDAADTVSSKTLPVGYVLSLEGADSVVTLKHLERSYAQGLRAIGPAHYGPGVYANGTGATGGFNAKGRDLLKEIERLGIILDATHLCDDCFWEALDWFHGPLWASHNNCRALVPHNRQFSDEQLKALIERGAVIGATLDAWMLVPAWVRGKTTPDQVGLKLERIIDHLDHVCQLAGNARHCGIGSDLDGAFGREQTPSDLNTIAGLARVPALLAARGYRAADVELILHGNFVRFLRQAWK